MCSQNHYCPIEEYTKFFLFLGWLTGVALLPVIGVWALTVILPFYTSLELLSYLCNRDESWCLGGELDD